MEINEEEIDRLVEYLLGLEDIHAQLWTQKDGTQIKLCDMSDRHIQNCINMLQRSEYKPWPHNVLGEEWVAALKAEQKRRLLMF